MSLLEKLSSLARGSAPVHLRLPGGAGTIRTNRAVVAGVATAAALLAGIPLAVRTLADYRQWLAIDAGGLPYNFFGYLVNVALKAFARSDLRVPAPYDAAKLQARHGPEASASYFPAGTPPPARRGDRPHVPGFTVPQRQTTQAGPADLLDRQHAFLAAVAAANPGVARRGPSAAEGGYHQALWLADDLAAAAGGRPGWLGLLKGEFAHPHGEGSAHVTLSLADAAALIERGWAERHPLSGVRWALPWGYVFVYAPRDDGEFAVWRDIVLASVRYNAAASGSEKEVVAPK